MTQVSPKTIIIAIVIAILLIFGYTQMSSSPGADKPITIGVISGLTGEYAAVGENFVRGFSLAHKEYMKRNPDARVELVVEDDKFNAREGVNAYRKMVDINNIDALFNMTSPTINAIYDLVTDTDLPVLQAGEQGQDPTDDNVFQMLAGNIDLEVKMGEYVRSLGQDNIALIHSVDPTFVRFAEAFKEGYGSQADDHIESFAVSHGGIGIGSTDYRTIATRVLAKNPSTIVLIINPPQGALIVKEMLNISGGQLNLVFDASFQTGFPEYQRALGDLSVIDGAFVMGIKEFSDPEFEKLYEEEYGVKPGFFSADSFDSFNLLMATYDPDKAKWLRNIKYVNFDGVSGRISFDEVGVRAPQTEAKIIKNGELVKK